MASKQPFPFFTRAKAQRPGASFAQPGLEAASEDEALLISGSIESVTPALGRRLWDRLGHGAIQALMESDSRASAILGRERLDKASTDLVGFEIYLPLWRFLAHKGLGPLSCRRVISSLKNERSDETPSMLLNRFRADPHALCELPGIGFAKADSIALSSGVGPSSEQRLLACAREACRSACENAGGGASLDDFSRQTEEFLCANEAMDRATARTLSKTAIDHARAKGIVKDALDENKTPLVFSAELHFAEEQCSHALLRMAVEESALSADNLEARVKDAEAKSGFELHDEQRAALFTLFKGRIALICGKPGAGKTTLLRAAAPILEQGGKKVIYAAPTGKAAKRMSQALDREAQTIHRVLGGAVKNFQELKNSLTDGSSVRLKEADALVIDESSMLDAGLLLRTLRALGPKTALILVGDPNQLPSVGPGKVFQDLLESGTLPTARLNKIMRQAEGSSITAVARAISDGTIPDFSDAQADCVFRETAPRDIGARISKLLESAAKAGYDPVKDSQILCASRKGAAGSFALNRHLQNALNPPDISKREALISDELLVREGDKVMQLSNDYERPLQASATDDSSKGKGIFNGDVGYVVSVKSLPYANHEILVQFEDGCAKYNTKDAKNGLSLAYACTVHKFQGSESPLAFIAMPSDTPYPLRTRNLLYTAVTRAKEKCVVLGDMGTLRACAARDALASRKTRLKGLLQGMIRPENAPKDVVALFEERALALELGAPSPSVGVDDFLSADQASDWVDAMAEQKENPVLSQGSEGQASLDLGLPESLNPEKSNGRAKGKEKSPKSKKSRRI